MIKQMKAFKLGQQLLLVLFMLST